MVALIRDKDMAHKLFAEIAPRTRIDPVATHASSSWDRAKATRRPWRASSSSERHRGFTAGGDRLCGGRGPTTAR